MELLESMVCMDCGTQGITIVAMDDDRNYVFCTHDCAKKHGWPWIKSEEKKSRKCPANT
jgi:hypothetical protein